MGHSRYSDDYYRLHPVCGGAPEESGDGDDGGAAGANPEFITDPDTGKRVRVEDVFEMRRQSTQRFQAASTAQERAESALARVFGKIGEQDGGAAAAPASNNAPAFDLEDVDLVGEDGLKELGKRLNLGVNASREEIRAEMTRREGELEKRLDDKLDKRDVERAVHQENVALLDAYLDDAKIPADRRGELRGEYVAMLKGLPKTSRFGSRGEDGYWRFNKAAMRAADMAIRGDEMVRTAETRAAEQARKKLIEDSDAPWDMGGGAGNGVTGKDFRAMPPAEQEAFMERFPNTDAKLDWLEANFSVDETIDILNSGANAQIKRSHGGYPRGQLV